MSCWETQLFEPLGDAFFFFPPATYDDLDSPRSGGDIWVCIIHFDNECDSPSINMGKIIWGIHQND